MCSVSCYKTTEFIKRTVPDDNDKLRNNSAKDIAKFLHYAEENSSVNVIKYRSSFLHQHYLTYIVHEDKMQAKIETNFPLLPRILKDHLHEIMTRVANKEDIIDQYPGTCWSLTFSCLHFLVVIENGKKDPFFVTFSGYHVEHMDAVIDTMGNNTLYHLRNNHPIIDGVELLQNLGGETWLVFI